ncbi:FAD-binding protein [Streptomyces sp. NPDC006510]|uniref:FAD-binding protein n=1 Tax=Streptomyces sp. NPDC006510 TaxID=3155600 RepID=UPI0033AD4E3C
MVTTGGIGANHDLVRRSWPDRLGTPPKHMVTGVPAYVDGRMLDIAADAGVRLVNRDRMWHYTEGVRNWDPIWPGHGIRILPGPSPMWFDALGRRLPDPCLPGYDTLGTLKHLRTTPDIAAYDHSWFVLTQKIIEKEFALSGSEQNPDITRKDPRCLPPHATLRQGSTRARRGVQAPRRGFRRRRHPRRTRRPDERSDRGAAARPRNRAPPDGGPRSADRQSLQQGLPGRATICSKRSAGWPARAGSTTS